MGNISIQDTGFVKPTNTGTQASNANRANGGTVIKLNTAQFTPSLKRNIDTNPDLASSDFAEVNLGSIENMKFDLLCMFDMTNAVEQSYAANIVDMVRTDGYKLMWYQYSDSIENNNGQLVFRLATNTHLGHELSAAERTEFGISGPFYHLHVHFFDIQPRHSGSDPNKVQFTLKGVVLKVEESQLV